MKDQTKIQLSSLEMALVTNPNWILTKNNVIQKVKHLLEQLRTEQQDILLHSGLPPVITTTFPKISKGENYQGLPYVILDQPRYFNKENIFAIRSLFWWGHFFSSTLHLSGSYKSEYEEKIIQAFGRLEKSDVSICINTDQWEHHFEAGNYIPVKGLTLARFKEIVHANPFIKLSQKIALREWDEAGTKMLETFRRYIVLLLLGEN